MKEVSIVVRQMDTKQEGVEQVSVPLQRWLPFLALFMMIGSLFLLDAVTSLGYIGFRNALLANLGVWPFLPAHILFPNLEVVHYNIAQSVPHSLAVDRAWKETALLFGAFVTIFLAYLIALRYLARMITFRYILLSTALLGILCVLFTVVPSQDIYSYIAYARMGVIYHLNPLVTLPLSLHKDPVFRYVYWTDQPSIYGPTWIIITSIVQWLVLQGGLPGLLAMVLSLRLIGLAAHLGSVVLIWRISGVLQRRYSFISTGKRLFATLAFAWNPLLLMEAAVNAHVDATVLLLILLAFWFLLQGLESKRALWLLVPVAILFGLAACLKLNVALLIVGLLFYLWFQHERVRKILLFMGVFLGMIVLLYAPFWQHGTLLQTIIGTPAAEHNMNTLADFFANFCNGVLYLFVPSTIIHTTAHVYIFSPAEFDFHMASVALFALVFIYLCWWAIRVPERINNIPGLIRWLALVWLVYCFIGSPWFWPWYLVTFFGLFALVEAITDGQKWNLGIFRLPLTVRLLTFSGLTLYCFFTWVGANSFVPGLLYFYWSDFRGLYMWVIPLLGLRFFLRRQAVTTAITHKLPATRWYQVRALLGKTSNSTTAS